MRIISIFFLLIVLVFSADVYAAKSFNFHMNVGQDNPDSGETRSGAATLLKFELINGNSIFRLGGGFTYLTGTPQFSQGELTLGPYIYPLGRTKHSPAQPFVFVLGKIGFGTLSDTSRTDAGYGMGAGVDMNVFSKGGFTVAVEQHGATESATRLWVGFFWR